MPTPAGGELAHDAEQPLDLGRRQRRGRLVQNENARGVGQRLGDGDDLPLADRQVADLLVHVESEADRIQLRLASAAWP